jgi:asparagine synthase (glutamine-hydrolysing)
VASFTVRFVESEYDEGSIAQQLIDHYHLNAHSLIVPGEELLSGLSAASWFNDEPLVHGNDLHLWAIARYAKAHVTVLLSGEGADETLGGYVRYRPLLYPQLLNAARTFFLPVTATLTLNNRHRKLNRFLQLGDNSQFVLYNACDTLPADLGLLGLTAPSHFAYREHILEDARKLYPHEPARQAMYSDQHTFLGSILDRNDRMTMGASIECREPFLDYRLVEGVAALPTESLYDYLGRGKQLLRRAFARRLPAAMLGYRKWGFGVPWRNYLREIPDLRQYMIDLPRAAVFDNFPGDLTQVKKVISRYLAGEDDLLPLARQLLMVAIWYETCVQRRPSIAADYA